MDNNELRERRVELKRKTDITLNNMKVITDESYRVADVAHNSPTILNNLEEEFEQQTGLDKRDVKFLFFATALQIEFLKQKSSFEDERDMYEELLDEYDKTIERLEEKVDRTEAENKLLKQLLIRANKLQRMA